MIRHSLFRKYLIVTLAVAAFCLCLGQLAFQMSNRMSDRIERDRMDTHPPQFFAHLVEGLRASGAAPDVVAATRVLYQAGRESMYSRPLVADEHGKIIYPEDPPFASVPPENLPSEPYTVNLLAEHGEPPVPDRPRSVIRLPGEPTRYLVLAPNPLVMQHRPHPQGPRGGFGDGRGPPPQGMFFLSLGYLAASVILATIISLLLLFYSMREKARLANSVISELQKGNLKARFPVRKLDEIGRAMLSFNRMADEIELLVERLKSTEQARVALLQELAHDLRTPVASLKNLLETLATRRDQLAEPVRAELMELSLTEVDYFERLVEDLLFLARVAEPRYRASCEQVRLAELLDEEIEACLSRHSGVGEGRKQIEFERDFESREAGAGSILQPRAAPGGAHVMGDPHLLRRLVRNALENACSFARTRVRVSVRPHPLNGGTVPASGTSSGAGTPGSLVEVLIEDDGRGLTPEALEAFGRRRVSRVVQADEERQGGRLSVGLGSVIMRTIAHLHRGEVSIANLSEANSGAVVRITLPTV